MHQLLCCWTDKPLVSSAKENTKKLIPRFKKPSRKIRTTPTHLSILLSCRNYQAKLLRFAIVTWASSTILLRTILWLKISLLKNAISTRLLNSTLPLLDNNSKPHFELAVKEYLINTLLKQHRLLNDLLQVSVFRISQSQVIQSSNKYEHLRQWTPCEDMWKWWPTSLN